MSKRHVKLFEAWKSIDEFKNPMGLALHKGEKMFILYDPHNIQEPMKNWDHEEMAENIFGVIELRWNEKHEAFEVKSVWAQKGYGPVMYLVALDHAEEKGLISTRQRGNITPEAKKIWKEFHEGKGKEYVKTKFLVNEDGGLSEDHKEDYLNKRYLIEEPYDTREIERSHEKLFKYDKYGEMINTLIEAGDSLLRGEMEKIYW